MSKFTTKLASVKIYLQKTMQWLWIGIICVLVVLAVGAGTNKFAEYQSSRQAAICPSLLSISRSARDTLLVMKAEPLCNNYVLKHLR